MGNMGIRIWGDRGAGGGIVAVNRMQGEAQVRAEV